MCHPVYRCLSIIFPLRLLRYAVPVEVLLQVVGHVLVAEAVGLAHRREPPPVLRVGVDLGGLEEEADALEVSLGGGDVQRRAAVVVARVEVDALQVVPGRRERERLSQQQSRALNHV